MSRKLNVYLCGKKVGVLKEDELAQLSFQYDSMEVSPLSVHLPVREEEYLHAQAYPFFENLTPEGESFEILTKGHISGNKTFSILDRFGGDCAGAVAFYETTPDNNPNETLIEISSDKVVQIIDKLPEDPLLTSLDNPPRLSLAGAQSKFAVYKNNDKYYRSDDMHPTTHIIKITNKRFPKLLNNELFCMKLAKNIRFLVPEVELKDVKSNQYLEIERYDRKEVIKIDDVKVVNPEDILTWDIKSHPTIERIHQEDFCQAIGIVSDKKYQSGGGARLKDCYQIIDSFSETNFIDVTRFIEWIMFNYLIGNTDSHAKNLSLLHRHDMASNGEDDMPFDFVELAPFYDLLSTEIYPQKIVDHTMAMLINGKGRYDTVRPKDFAALFDNLGLNATNTMKVIRDKFSNIVKIAETLRDELNSQELTKSDIYDDIITIIKKRFAVVFG